VIIPRRQRHASERAAILADRPEPLRSFGAEAEDPRQEKLALALTLT